MSLIKFLYFILEKLVVFFSLGVMLDVQKVHKKLVHKMDWLLKELGELGPTKK